MISYKLEIGQRYGCLKILGVDFICLPGSTSYPNTYLEVQAEVLQLAWLLLMLLVLQPSACWLWCHLLWATSCCCFIVLTTETAKRRAASMWPWDRRESTLAAHSGMGSTREKKHQRNPLIGFAEPIFNYRATAAGLGN